MNRVLRLLVVLMVLVVACGDDDATTTTSTAAPSTTTAVTTTSPTSTTAVTTATTTTAVEDGVISISVAIGSEGVDLIVEGSIVEPGSRVAVETGAAIHIVLSGSVSEELHIHGYDLSLEIDSGGVDELDFTADIPGIFEVELEGAHTLVFELEVS